MERERQERWDAAHLCTAATRLKAEQYILIRAICALQGTTVYALIKSLLEAWLAELTREPDAQIEGQQEIC